MKKVKKPTTLDGSLYVVVMTTTDVCGRQIFKFFAFPKKAKNKIPPTQLVDLGKSERYLYVYRLYLFLAFGNQ